MEAPEALVGDIRAFFQQLIRLKRAQGTKFIGWEQIRNNRFSGL
jgi:hypothetical protein